MVPESPKIVLSERDFANFFGGGDAPRLPGIIVLSAPTKRKSAERTFLRRPQKCLHTPQLAFLKLRRNLANYFYYLAPEARKVFVV